MNRKKVEEIIELMERYGLTEIDVEEEGVRIHLKKGASGVETVIHPSAVPQQVAMVPAGKEVATSQEVKKLTEVKAPMVGTFYNSPAPDAQPYVRIGDTVNEGDVLCIIEAMKLMNEIKCEVKGKIADILIENGQPVEFGQILFHVDQS